MILTSNRRICVQNIQRLFCQRLEYAAVSCRGDGAVVSRLRGVEKIPLIIITLKMLEDPKNEKGGPVKLRVNGQDLEVTADPDTPLLWVLREELRLIGAKYGCGIAQCGVCTVFVEGSPVRSCVTPLRSAEGKSITTPEGLEGPVAEAVRTAWIVHEVAQCGFCQSGQILGAIALLQTTSSPSESEILETMSPYLCRCATYGRIRLALLSAAQTLRG